MCDFLEYLMSEGSPKLCEFVTNNFMGSHVRNVSKRHASLKIDFSKGAFTREIIKQLGQLYEEVRQNKRCQLCHVW